LKGKQIVLYWTFFWSATQARSGFKISRAIVLRWFRDRIWGLRKNALLQFEMVVLNYLY